VEKADKADIAPLELPPGTGVYYKSFTYTFGGATHGDFYTFAIGHNEGERFVVDVVRGIPGPFDPYLITRGFAELCKQYRITTVTGDRYGKEWVQAAWRATGIAYVHDLTTAWRATGKEDVVPDAPKASGNDAMPVDDVETAYRLYAEEISQAWKTPK
jgi:hypothetical protein